MREATKKDKANVVNVRAADSPYLPGQRVGLYDWNQNLIEEVTVSEVMPNVAQCRVVRLSGTKELVSERRLRA